MLTYFARYGRGGPLKESRILSADGETVTFRESLRNEPFQAVTLPVDVFLYRWLRHVPPHNYRTLRSCGLYAPNADEKRQRARAALGQATEVSEPTGSKKDSDLADHDRREVCGKKLEIVAKIPRPQPRPKKRARPVQRLSWAFVSLDLPALRHPQPGSADLRTGRRIPAAGTDSRRRLRGEVVS